MPLLRRPHDHRREPRARRRVLRSSDDAVAAQAMELLRTDTAELAQERASVLAEKRWTRYLDPGIRELDRTADGLVGAAGRVIDVEDHLARLQMRVRQYLTGV